MNPSKTSEHRRPVRESLEEYGRGVAGGLLFSLPLIYTMEVWWHGFIANPTTLLIYVGFTYLVLLGYNRYSGMHHDASFAEVMIDSIEEMGIGLIVATVILALMERISLSMPLAEVVGKIVMEGMTVAIGVSVGTAQLGMNGESAANGKETRSGSNRERPPVAERAVTKPGKPPHAWEQLVLGFCGAILIASNVAPTEEIVMLGVEASPVMLLGLMLLSLLVCALVLNFSGFSGSDRHVRRDAGFWGGYGVVSSYAVALVAAALMLWFFGRFQGQSAPAILAQTVVLALPAVLGSSAGRLLIQ